MANSYIKFLDNSENEWNPDNYHNMGEFYKHDIEENEWHKVMHNLTIPFI